MEGYTFRRNVRFGAFTVEFAEHDVGLVIMLEDGDQAGWQSRSVRDRVINTLGYMILRLNRGELEQDLSITLRRIKCLLEELGMGDSV